MTLRKNKKPPWARNLDGPEENVVIALTLISEDSGPTTIDALRVAWEPLLADALVIHEVANDPSSEAEANEVAPPGSRLTSLSTWRNVVLWACSD
jgi:hypothetical protein